MVSKVQMSDKLAYDVQTVADIASVSPWTIRDAIKKNELVARYTGVKRTKAIILAAELERWLSSLPTERGETTD